MMRHVYATESYEYLQRDLARQPGFQIGEVLRRRFPDGERGLTFPGSVKGREAVLIGGTGSDRDTLDLFDFAFGLTSYGVDSLCLVIPYFGYSTQERASTFGEVVTAKSRCLLLSALPKARLGTEVLLVDLHTPGICHYFEGELRTFQLSAQPLILELINRLKSTDRCTLGCTDAGRAKWVQGLANTAHLPAAFVYKARQADGSLRLTGVNADVRGSHVIVYDDMVRTGGSLIQAAEAYLNAGAAKVTAVTTHAVLPAEKMRQLAGCGLFAGFYCSDSLPVALEHARSHPGFVQVLPLTSALLPHFSAS